jgi:heme-degrading monooxygenase HmoA
MHARVITGQYQSGKMDEGLQLFHESILPETRQQRGFQGVTALVDRSTGKGMTITFWQTEADAQASGASSPYLQAQLAKIVSLFSAAPTIEMYEVVVQE